MSTTETTSPASATAPLAADAGAADHTPARAIPLSGQPHPLSAPRLAVGEAHPLFTPALGRILAARTDQVERHGHTPARDDAIGAAALVGMARSKIIRIERQLLREVDQLTQEAGDMLQGNADRVATMSDGERAALDRRLCAAGALIVAALDVLDRSGATE